MGVLVWLFSDLKGEKMVRRKDKKGRVLREGETVRADGRYAYNYTDLKGKRAFVYSWKLEETDPLPTGKRKCKALRELEREIQRGC